MATIVSTVEGRMRIRSKRLKSAQFGKSFEQEIAGAHGVRETRLNTSAGSLVVMFDAKTLDSHALEDKAFTLLNGRNGNSSANTAPKRGRIVSKRMNQAAKAGMLSSLAASMLYAYSGNKKQHILYGKAFLAFAGVHIARHSRQIFN